MSNETVTYSLESVLKEIKDSIKEVNQKMDTLQKDVNDLKVGQAKLTEKVEGMDKRLEKVENEQYTLVKTISDLQGFRGLLQSHTPKTIDNFRSLANV
ncbi:MAG: shikimate dehydrogenase [Microcystis sp. M_OC_Ca_00000000_S217Cul]|uniref:shikimate dehydrogenase n=1 Tax=Microcystis sp. M_OC_Ca_00000000_S217Cul TaxID=2486214 RepID=UPI00118EE8F7|nr:shikimate dehydrogenase [Microcystis sp. M_OC_Ca_00000000_S217Cul]TRT77774.1 MAG: shikimate dehydrogenase [Microcystis sp. M_OC_Ca_00000000_S217Cul]